MNKKILVAFILLLLLSVSVLFVFNDISNKKDSQLRVSTSEKLPVSQELSGYNIPADTIEENTLNGTTYLTLDLLELNPEFKPGLTNYFLNSSPELYRVEFTEDTKAYLCFIDKGSEVNLGPDNDPTSADVLVDIDNYFENYNSGVFFDIKEGVILVVYEQCLP